MVDDYDDDDDDDNDDDYNERVWLNEKNAAHNAEADLTIALISSRPRGGNEPLWVKLPGGFKGIKIRQIVRVSTTAEAQIAQ